MYEQQRPYIDPATGDYYESAYDYEAAQPRQIATFAPSVESRLAQARQLLLQGRTGDASAVLQNVGAELARSSPELFALTLLSQMGVRSVTFEETESDVRTTTNDSYFLGMRYSQNVKTEGTVRSRKRTVRLG